MSDNNEFSRSINVSGNAVQDIAATGNIQPGATVVAVDSTGGVLTVSLPDQVGAAGQVVKVVSVDATAVVTIAVQTGDSFKGAVDASTTISSGTPYASLIFASQGAGGWTTVL